MFPLPYNFVFVKSVLYTNHLFNEIIFNQCTYQDFSPKYSNLYKLNLESFFKFNELLITFKIIKMMQLCTLHQGWLRDS